MSIFDRISLLLRSNINSALTSAEDPQKVLDQLIVDMRKEFVDAKKHAAVAIAEERRLYRQLERADAEVSSWEQKAVTALQGGREDLARAAMERKLSTQRQADDLRPLWEQQRQQSEQIRGALVKLNERIEEANRKKSILIARAKRAEAQKQIQAAMGGIGSSSALSHFDRMERKVEQLEAEADASELLGEVDASLDHQFKQLEADNRGTEADMALLELKARMGLPGVASSPIKQLADSDE